MRNLRSRILFLGALASVCAGLAMAAEMPPGVQRDPGLHAELEAAYAAKGPGHVPRTHLMDGGRARHVNRLILEPSPYLLQHAHNPVDWRPWSHETLAEARARDLPIFLSVGYATCHWCHVMEEESFDNEAIAAVLNAGFLPVKIDREEMPDLDHLYVTATQIQQGHGGWPNSVFLLPDGRPFHTGTYFPPDVFGEMLELISAAWADPRQRAQMEMLAGELSEAVRQVTQMPATQSAPLDDALHARAAASLLDMHNALEGGFSQDQQFPQEGYLLFLMDHWRRTGDEASLGVATETLYAIAAGGIHDHAGGGFHRYTVDPNWRTPHFEKMLYNQGLLARAFIEAWEITGEPVFRRAAERTFAYVARDMTDPEGAFHAAEDADSPDATGAREEGAFYVFTPDEIAAAAGPEAVAALGLDAEPTLEAGGVIHLPLDGVPDFARLDPLLDAARKARETRPRPLRDDKIIAGWNGLMIRALAEGAVAFERPTMPRGRSRPPRRSGRGCGAMAVSQGSGLPGRRTRRRCCRIMPGPGWAFWPCGRRPATASGTSGPRRWPMPCGRGSATGRGGSRWRRPTGRWGRSMQARTGRCPLAKARRWNCSPGCRGAQLPPICLKLKLSPPPISPGRRPWLTIP